jgi:methionyl-tRNA formyltransferase
MPFPGAWTVVAGERLKLLSGTTMPGSGAPGTALGDSLLVACGEGAYRIDKAQRAGKGVMERDELLRGFSVPRGTRFA